MNKIILLITVFSFVAVNNIVVAQQRGQDDKHHQEKREKYRTEKIAFLTDKLDLTPQEAQKFWPIYNDKEEKVWTIQRSRRELEHKARDAEETMSEKEVIKLTRDFAENMQKESDLHAEYNEKFLKVLPPHKVLHLYDAENQFRKHMIKKYWERKRNGNRD